MAGLAGTFKYYSELKFINTQYKEGFNADNIIAFNIPIVEIPQYAAIIIVVLSSILFLLIIFLVGFSFKLIY